MIGRKFRKLFIFLQIILYISFLSQDIMDGNATLSNYIKFSVVALCLLYVLLKGSGNSDKQLLFLRLALTFTLVSDVLILLSDYYFYGVLTFIIAQQFHGIRISVLEGKKVNLVKDTLTRLLYQALLGLATGLILWKFDISINGLLAASIFYFICILTNTVRSVRFAALLRDKKIIYLAVGMILFLLCDINVGLFNLSDFLPVGPVYEKIYSVSSILMWTFYAPSQVMISLSGDNL